MKPQVTTQYDSFDDPLLDAEGLEVTSEVSRLIPDFNCSRKLKLRRWNFILALHQRVKIPELHSPAALVRFTLNLSRLRW